MGKRGKYKYICEDCQAVNWLSSRDRTSRFKPKCVECGSPWLIPSNKSIGPKKIADFYDATKKSINLRNKKMGK